MKTVFGKLTFIMLLVVLTASLSAQWQLIPTLSKTDFHSAVQLTDTKAFVVGDKGMLLTTNDRGSTWHTINLHIGTNFNSIKFVDGDTYYNSYIVGDLGVILRTDCRWRSWEIISVAPNYNNNDVSFVNELNGVVVGYKYLTIGETPISFATLLVTHDGGLTWTDKSPMLMGKFNSVKYFETGKAVAVGDAGLVAFTNDGGENWYFRRLTTSNLNEVTICKITGIKMIVGDKGALFVCKDEDRYRWVDCSISSFYNLNSLCQVGLTFVIAAEKKLVTESDQLRKSVILESKELNGPWKEVFGTTTGAFKCVNFCGKNSAIAVGQNGTMAVYYRALSQDTVICVDSPKKIVTQNYPNPFNPSTKIGFNLIEQSNVELKIYDVLGNEVATLVNGVKPAGSYEAEWNASGLPSGVYIYQLKAGNNTQLKKMILMK